MSRFWLLALLVGIAGGEGQPPQLLDSLFEVDALHRLDNALSEASAEEHS